jgi:hypothetical protein
VRRVERTVNVRLMRSDVKPTAKLDAGRPFIKSTVFTMQVEQPEKVSEISGVTTAPRAFDLHDEDDNGGINDWMFDDDIRGYEDED